MKAKENTEEKVKGKVGAKEEMVLAIVKGKVGVKEEMVLVIVKGTAPMKRVTLGLGLKLSP